jgi:hypothetical protein
MNPDKLLQKIMALQANNQAFFEDGLFPAFRENRFFNYKRTDENLFITASIFFILDAIKTNFDADNQLLIEKSKAIFLEKISLFQQKDGLKTYNFYQTKPNKHFPNGWLLHRLRHFKLPEDIDDTALAYLIAEPPLEDVLWLKEKLKPHANLSRISIKNTFQHYRQIKVYSTWFGEKMPIEFDACALCNLLFLFKKYDLPENEFDHDSIRFLAEIIERNEYKTAPIMVALNYPRTALILYHFGRLMQNFKIEALEKHRNTLIESCLELLKTEKNQFERLLLSTALMKLSGQADKYSFDLNLEKDSQSKPFFVAGFLSGFSNKFIKKLANLPIFQINWQSEALLLTLQLENEVLRKTLSSQAST